VNTETLKSEVNFNVNSSASRKTKERIADSTPHSPRPYEELRHSSTFPFCCPNCICRLLSRFITHKSSTSSFFTSVTHNIHVQADNRLTSPILIQLWWIHTTVVWRLSYYNTLITYTFFLPVRQLQSEEHIQAWILIIAFSEHINTTVHFSCNYSQ
jgi:hypothetical protein